MGMVWLWLSDLFYSARYEWLIFPAYAPYMPFVVTYLVLSAILYPFSYYTSEKLALKIMTKPFWDRHIGVNSGVYGMFIILWYFACRFLYRYFSYIYAYAQKLD